ncbi:hypothetical protein I302_101127 [Kwoniella bestiolae CBS 10118]|uniref:Kinase n=1 Tax=Kwoniella bestiolae CBS 10118 TaxID=1296100 RepID=A0A1B9G732_9TREE|nr:hypothetical protein I302_04503 [Kwoniella bestiolae CBS 10118]OCF26813.1 hypothetical protein I302_04503 [Kwoniella bestiolae CBS 10118]
MTPSPSLSLTDRTPLANQVAGHDGVMSDASGSLVIKPALAREIAFYQTLNSSDREDPIRRLKPFVPKFLGTLRLEGQLSSAGDVQRLEGKEEVPESVVLENLSYAFTHPSILDVKLGTVLYDPDASEEKKQRMDKQARETTTHELGIRFTGCTTWHAPTQSYILTPKSFGKSIKPAQLPEGMVRFFPSSSDSIASLLPPTPPADRSVEGAPAVSVDTSGGIPPTPITASNSTSVPSEGQTYKDHSIPSTLLVKVLNIILEEIDRLVSVLSELEIRFVGGSLLIVYEGDPEKLTEASDRYELNKLKAAHAEGEERSAFSDDGSNPSDDDESEEDEDEEDEEARAARKCPPVRVKMIDFAHTWLAQGEGPDQGVLKGLATLRGLIEGRKREIEG